MIRPLLLIARRELVAQRNATLGWLVPLALLMMLYASLQPQVAGDDGLLAAKLAVLPEGLKQAFNLNATDFGRPVGYLSTNFLVVTLGASLFSGLLGANVVAREDAHRTSESVLTLPVERWQVLGGKLLAALTWLAVFFVVVGAATAGSLARVATRPIEGGLIASMFFGAFLLGIFFLAAGMLGATVLQARVAPSMAMGLVLGTYFLGVISKVAPKAEGAGVVSPYRLVEPADVVQAGGLEPRAALLVVVSIVALAGAFGWFSRKDVHA
ncbi:MAG: ABC transporter permease [Myxococcaceae bacterium]|jgi:ABC-2 type transport system permease protein|nr:ABC transporter permease [Myxococcaceae bacterium]